LTDPRHHAKVVVKEYEKALKERKKVLREHCGAMQRRTT